MNSEQIPDPYNQNIPAQMQIHGHTQYREIYLTVFYLGT